MQPHVFAVPATHMMRRKWLRMPHGLPVPAPQTQHAVPMGETALSPSFSFSSPTGFFLLWEGHSGWWEPDFPSVKLDWLMGRFPSCRLPATGCEEEEAMGQSGEA